MERRVLGRTGIEVTQLGFGSMELRGPDFNGREVSDPQAEGILNAVLDAGINFIDTSPDYGRAEELIGRFISRRRREFTLATKCGCNPAERNHIWTRDQVKWNLETSLQRMRVDRVDLIQLHNPKLSEVDLSVVEDLVRLLTEFREQGLTRFVGISTTLPWISDYVKLGVFDTFQIPYSCTEPEHHEAITLVAESGAGIIIRGGIGYGGPQSAVLRRVKIDMWNRARLNELCGDMSAAELILRYTLSHPHCNTTIVGTMSPLHLAENVAAAARGPLPKDLYDEITRRVQVAAKELGEAT